MAGARQAVCLLYFCAPHSHTLFGGLVKGVRLSRDVSILARSTRGSLAAVVNFDRRQASCGLQCMPPIPLAGIHCFGLQSSIPTHPIPLGSPAVLCLLQQALQQSPPFRHLHTLLWLAPAGPDLPAPWQACSSESVASSESNKLAFGMGFGGAEQRYVFLCLQTVNCPPSE